MYAYKHKYISTHILYIYIQIYVYVCIYLCIHEYTDEHISTLVFMYISMCEYVYVYMNFARQHTFPPKYVYMNRCMNI